MGFLKFTAPAIFDGQSLRDTSNDVLVCSADGTIEEIIRREDAGDDVQQFSGILTPGFINCHCHLELSHLRGKIGRLTGLPAFATQVVQHRQAGKEEILAAIDMAEEQMWQGGIVAAGDICNGPATLTAKSKGKIWYHNFVEIAGVSDSIAHTRFSSAVDLFRAFGSLYSIPTASNSIVPHAPYSVSGALWQLITHFPGNQLLTVHNQEDASENELFEHSTGPMLELYNSLGIDHRDFKPSGRRSLPTYLPHMLPNQSLILVHNVDTSEADKVFAETLARDKSIQLNWCICINANQYITGHVPPLNLLASGDSNIVLGTDSLASNDQLSILAEMRSIKKHFPEIALSTILGWATYNGAKALQLGSMLGRFEKGMKPGILNCSADLEGVTRLA